MSPITKYTFTNTKYIIPGAFIIISIIAAGLYLKATVFRGKPSQSSLAVRFTAKNGGYPGDVKI